MSFYIRRPRQAIGGIYIFLYTSILVAYLVILPSDQSWAVDLKFTTTVFVWFVLSFAVKISMLMNRSYELLNLFALVAFVSIGFTYNPVPGHHSPIENFVYYLYVTGGAACDAFDFIYEAVPKRQEGTS